jgi:hypothetical protein
MTTEPHTKAIKAQLQAEFPSWSIIVTRPWGRWWATRGPHPGEQVQHGASCLEADTPEQLRARLREVDR